MSDSHSLTLSPQDALVALMVAVSCADEDDPHRRAGAVSPTSINNLPVFADYDTDNMQRVSPDGLFFRPSASRRTGSTLCSVSCGARCPTGSARLPMRWPATWPPQTVVVAQSESRILEEIRYELDIDRLHAAAIERGARGAAHDALRAVSPRAAPLEIRAPPARVWGALPPSGLRRSPRDTSGQKNQGRVVPSRPRRRGTAGTGPRVSRCGRDPSGAKGPAGGLRARPA